MFNTAPPQAPLDWVASTFGGLNRRETLEYLVPTADLPRQGREEQVVTVWSHSFDLKASPRTELLYIFGTSGVGQTSLLRYVAERIDSDLEELPPSTRAWVRQDVTVAWTINNHTP